jgi:ubiquinone biosynthesis protein UbiJ
VTAPALLSAALEVALNRTLRLEPSVLRDCERLSGRLLALELSDWNWQFIIEFAPSGVRVLTELPPGGKGADVRVAASSPQLLGSALRMTAGEPLASATRAPTGNLANVAESGGAKGLNISGDVELLQTFAEMLRRVDLNPEELLARVMPEGAAHRVASALSGFGRWGRRTTQRFAEDASEYLREESGDLVGNAEVEEWTREVEALRAQVDRVEARIAAAERRATASRSS